MKSENYIKKQESNTKENPSTENKLMLKRMIIHYVNYRNQKNIDYDLDLNLDGMIGKLIDDGESVIGKIKSCKKLTLKVPFYLDFM
jgi:hypothetical protein